MRAFFDTKGRQEAAYLREEIAKATGLPKRQLFMEEVSSSLYNVLILPPFTNRVKDDIRAVPALKAMLGHINVAEGAVCFDKAQTQSPYWLRCGSNISVTSDSGLSHASVLKDSLLNERLIIGSPVLDGYDLLIKSCTEGTSGIILGLTLTHPLLTDAFPDSARPVPAAVVFNVDIPVYLEDVMSVYRESDTLILAINGKTIKRAPYLGSRPNQLSYPVVDLVGRVSKVHILPLGSHNPITPLVAWAPSFPWKLEIATIRSTYPAPAAAQLLSVAGEWSMWVGGTLIQRFPELPSIPIIGSSGPNLLVEGNSLKNQGELGCCCVYSHPLPFRRDGSRGFRVTLIEAAPDAVDGLTVGVTLTAKVPTFDNDSEVCDEIPGNSLFWGFGGELFSGKNFTPAPPCPAAMKTGDVLTVTVHAGNFNVDLNDKQVTSAVVEKSEFLPAWGVVDLLSAKAARVEVQPDPGLAVRPVGMNIRMIAANAAAVEDLMKPEARTFLGVAPLIRPKFDVFVLSSFASDSDSEGLTLGFAWTESAGLEISSFIDSPDLVPSSRLFLVGLDGQSCFDGNFSKLEKWHPKKVRQGDTISMEVVNDTHIRLLQGNVEIENLEIPNPPDAGFWWPVVDLMGSSTSVALFPRISEIDEIDDEPVVQAEPEPVVHAQPEPAVQAEPEPVVHAQPEPVVHAQPEFTVLPEPLPQSVDQPAAILTERIGPPVEPLQRDPVKVHVPEPEPPHPEPVVHIPAPVMNIPEPAMHAVPEPATPTSPKKSGKAKLAVEVHPEIASPESFRSRNLEISSSVIVLRPKSPPTPGSWSSDDSSLPSDGEYFSPRRK